MRGDCLKMPWDAERRPGCSFQWDAVLCSKGYSSMEGGRRVPLCMDLCCERPTGSPECSLSAGSLQTFHRITEYPGLEGTHQCHWPSSCPCKDTPTIPPRASLLWIFFLLYRVALPFHFPVVSVLLISINLEVKPLLSNASQCFSAPFKPCAKSKSVTSGRFCAVFPDNPGHWIVNSCVTFSSQSCLIRWEIGEYVSSKRVAAEHLAEPEPRKWQEKGK